MIDTKKSLIKFRPLIKKLDRKVNWNFDVFDGKVGRQAYGFELETFAHLFLYDVLMCPYNSKVKYIIQTKNLKGYDREFDLRNGDEFIKTWNDDLLKIDFKRNMKLSMRSASNFNKIKLKDENNNKYIYLNNSYKDYETNNKNCFYIFSENKIDPKTMKVVRLISCRSYMFKAKCNLPTFTNTGEQFLDFKNPPPNCLKFGEMVSFLSWIKYEFDFDKTILKEILL